MVKVVIKHFFHYLLNNTLIFSAMTKAFIKTEVSCVFVIKKEIKYTHPKEEEWKHGVSSSM